MSSTFLIMIAGCFLVTWLPRILPFVFAKRLEFPEKLHLFLSYLPLCILAALLVQSVLSIQSGKAPILKLQETLACIPTLMVGIYTKNLMKIVITGIISIAVIRLVL
uniref:AzlD domain-containing protein n=1 Tax=Candidatus Enterococcus willemsii TaxID=1857215 RepID=UPI00403F8F98